MRGVFRTFSSICDRAFLQKYVVNGLKIGDFAWYPRSKAQDPVDWQDQRLDSQDHWFLGGTLGETRTPGPKTLLLSGDLEHLKFKWNPRPETLNGAQF